MRSDVAPQRRRVPGSLVWRRVAVGAGCTLLLAAVVWLTARDAIEREYLQRMLAGALDADVTLGDLHHRDGRAVIDGLRVQTPLGTIVTADSVVYRQNGTSWTVEPSDVRVSLAGASEGFPDLSRLATVADDLGIERLTLRLRDAGLTLTAADGSAAVEIAGITGVVHAGPAPAYALDGDVVDDRAPSGAYPLSAQAQTAGGRTVYTLSAAALPLAGIGALLDAADFRIDDGIARDVAATYDGTLHATMTLAGVHATLGTTVVDRVGGPLTIVSGGVGSGGLDATLEPAGIPLAITGEAHDLGNWTHGSRDLGMLATMIEKIGAQPNLRWSNVETTAPGIVYGQYAMTTGVVPHVVQLIAIDPREPTLHFDTALADDHIISTGARTTDLGLRTHAVAGVNGDYFDIGRTYEPQGLLIRSGTLLHGPTDHEAVIIDRTNHLVFARFHLRGSVTDGARTYRMTLVNSWPTRDVTLITPDYGHVLPAAPGVTFATLEPISGTLYRVTGLHSMTAPFPVSLGLGFAAQQHQPLPRVGDVVDVQYALDPPVAGALAGVGSGPLLVHDGRWYEDTHAPAPDERDVQWPVIAIGDEPDGTVLFAAVDGRHPERSIGMTRPEFGGLLQRFGVVDAMALDSGGSVTMVARSPGAHAVTLHNVPSDFSAERYVSDALFVYSSAPEGTIVTAVRPHVEPTPGLR